MSRPTGIASEILSFLADNADASPSDIGDAISGSTTSARPNVLASQYLRALQAREFVQRTGRAQYRLTKAGRKAVNS